MIPLYGFLQGDTIGILVLADEAETMASLARKLESASSVRVAPRPQLAVVVGGCEMAAEATVRQVGLGTLDRFDVIAAEAR